MCHIIGEFTNRKAIMKKGFSKKNATGIWNVNLVRDRHVKNSGNLESILTRSNQPEGSKKNDALGLPREVISD